MAGEKTPGPVGTVGKPEAEEKVADGTATKTATPAPGPTGSVASTDPGADAAKKTEKKAEAKKDTGKTKSGKSWVAWANKHAKKSNDIDDLEKSFAAKVKEFKKALEEAGASISISTTKRSAKRAYLFHWSWKIALGKCKPSDATAKPGVDIEWDHGDLAKSKAGADEMVKGFALKVPPASKYPPSLSSKHIKGKAIDWTITWKDKIEVYKKDKSKVEIDYMKQVDNNTKLHEVGASYGVKKLVGDEPHWSDDGS